MSNRDVNDGAEVDCLQSIKGNGFQVDQTGEADDTLHDFTFLTRLFAHLSH